MQLGYEWEVCVCVCVFVCVWLADSDPHPSPELVKGPQADAAKVCGREVAALPFVFICFRCDLTSSSSWLDGQHLCFVCLFPLCCKPREIQLNT